MGWNGSTVVLMGSNGFHAFAFVLSTFLFTSEDKKDGTCLKWSKTILSGISAAGVAGETGWSPKTLEFIQKYGKLQTTDTAVP